MPHQVEVEFDDFGWQLLTEEAERQGVSVEDLVRHATLYFLAERDDRRFARRVIPLSE